MISVTVQCNVYSASSVEVTIEVNVGAPYQGDIRNLATDRWYSMYPS